jgi:hypothetical protein
MANPNQLFPSMTILHLVEVVSKNAASPAYDFFVKKSSIKSITVLSNEPNLDDKKLKKAASADNLPSAETTANNSSSEPVAGSSKRTGSGKKNYAEIDRAARINDLLNFVGEITSSDDFVKDCKQKLFTKSVDLKSTLSARPES